jgi:predicted amidophosphoribosyltransferase
VAPTKNSAKNWLKEERRKTLGDWVAVCLVCGFAVRYVDDREDELPPVCPQCAGELRFSCPECGARFSSAFAVECEACGGALRASELFGIPIRKQRRR